MKASEKARGRHSCAEVTIKNSQQVLISGGLYDASEIYSVSSNTWTRGPNLPNFSSVGGEIVSYLNQVYYAGGYRNFDIYQLKDDWTQQDAWIMVSTYLLSMCCYYLVQIGRMTHPRSYFPAMVISQDVCPKRPTPTTTPTMTTVISTTTKTTILDSPLLYLGPGAKPSGAPVGLSEVFTLPTDASGLKTARCQIPQDTNKANTKGMVGFVLDGHLTLCGRKLVSSGSQLS